MQTIDPIKPYGPRHHAKPHVVRAMPPPPRPHPKITRQSIDGIVPLSPLTSIRPEPRLVQPVRKPLPLSQTQPVSPQLSSQFSPQLSSNSLEPEITQKKRFNIPRITFSKKGIAVAVAFIAILIATAVVTQKPVGQLMVLLYGVMAVIMKIPSRTTFVLALGALVLVPVSLAVIGDTNIISSGLATYAFLLLVIGTVSLGLELRRESKLELA